MNRLFNNVLVLSPHTDDGELGAGGAISKLVEEGSVVSYAAFSTAEESVPDHLPRDILKTEVKAATALLGIDSENLILYDYPVRKLNYYRQEILESLIELRNINQFDLVLMPSLKDIHQDHKTIAEEGLRAFKETTILSYELMWNNLSFDTTSFIKLRERDVQRKVEALACYESQAHRGYMSKEFIYSLARSRGTQIGADYAESFEVLRWVIN
ncbi:MAG: PIG-L family deacetylase [Pseudomonadales bacterium]|nr:PIG-L family deacetylase [Pseudomonadales bacterium]